MKPRRSIKSGHTYKTYSTWPLTLITNATHVLEAESFFEPIIRLYDISRIRISIDGYLLMTKISSTLQEKSTKPLMLQSSNGGLCNVKLDPRATLKVFDWVHRKNSEL